jgi:hypothetical protein
MVSSAHPDLWTLALEHQQVGPLELMEAIEQEIGRPPLDFRTRLLIRDSLNALSNSWGKQRVTEWLARSRGRDCLVKIWEEELGPAGFPSLERRIMEPTRADTIIQFLRELSRSITEPTSIAIGGSIALILAGYLTRRTEDIDIVDEVPVKIRSQHDLLHELSRLYDLQLTHFQSHYLPDGWEGRLRHFDRFGPLEVRLVDPCDMFLSKLFSAREKDRKDLQVLAKQLDKSLLIERLASSTASLRKDGKLGQQAEKNWYVLFGEALPV